nr:MAG TPA: hypothetical protein [Caudoviricetes sp.]
MRAQRAFFLSTQYEVLGTTRLSEAKPKWGVGILKSGSPRIAPARNGRNGLVLRVP